MPNLSRVQNQSVYTRRFNVLKNKITKDVFTSVESDDTVAVRFGPESCIIDHNGGLGFSLHFYNELGEFEQTVQVVKACGRFYTGLIGIHVHDTNLHHLQDVIEQALKDNFPAIYIHSIESLKGAV